MLLTPSSERVSVVPISTHSGLLGRDGDGQVEGCWLSSAASGGNKFAEIPST